MSTAPPTGEAPLRVLLVDDHELVRAGLAAAFAREPGVEVVGEAGSVGEALDAVDALAPDVVVSDLQLPDGTGLDVVRSVRASPRAIGVVIVTMHAGDDQIFAAMTAGASGFVGKDAPAGDVVRTVRHAARTPRAFVSNGLAGAMTRRLSGESAQLSEREHQILLLLADGLAVGQIATSVHISESTAKTHVARIYQKLGVSNRAQAVVTAMRLGLISSLQPPR